MLDYKPIDELDERLLHELKVSGLYQEILDLKAAGLSLEALPPSVMSIRLQCQEAASFIEEHGCAVQRDAYRRATPLMVAARKGDIHFIHSAIAGDKNLEARDKAGCTALIYAAQSGQKGVVETLIRADVNVNTADKEGNTALHHAIKNGHFNLVESLVLGGADIFATNKAGETPLLCMQPTPENAETFAFLAAHDYRELRFKNPELYKKQQKIIRDWIAKDPANARLFRRAFRRVQYDAQASENQTTPLDTLRRAAHEINEPAPKMERVSRFENA